MNKTHWYLIAYDIRHPKRLSKTHKYLKKKGGLALQKSLFAWTGSVQNLEKLKKGLTQYIDEQEDDLRIYPIASLEAIELWGKAKKSPLLSQAPPKTPWQKLKRWILYKKGQWHG